MKLVNRYIDKHGAGHVTLRPEDNEDMWHLYNLIAEGDSVRATALRRVQNVSSTGSTESHRVRTQLTIQVSKVEFSPSVAPAQEGGGDQGAAPAASLHISGPVISENQYVRMGAFHTLDIEPNRDIRIEKSDGWDSIARKRVEDAIVPGRGAEVAALVCGEGTAAFCLLSEHMTIVPHRISMSIPRKAASAGTSQHEKGMDKFYATIYESFLRHIPYANPSLRAIVIASPGWIRDSVYDYLLAEALKRNDKNLQKVLREKTLKVHVNSPHVHSLVEVLKSPEVSSQLKEAKFAKEGVALDRLVHGTAPIMYDLPVSEEQSAPCSSLMTCSARAIPQLGRSMLRWLKGYKRLEERWSYFPACTNQASNSTKLLVSLQYLHTPSMWRWSRRRRGKKQRNTSAKSRNSQSSGYKGLSDVIYCQEPSCHSQFDPFPPFSIEALARKMSRAVQCLFNHTVRRLVQPLSSFPLPRISMSKRERSASATHDAVKRTRVASPGSFTPIKVATPEAAAAADANPPLKQLVEEMKKGVKVPSKGDCVAYWMRMTDMRLSDNRGLSNACMQSRMDGVPVIVLFVISPQDYIAHDRGARKIDFTLRNLRLLKERLADLDIPLHAVSFTPRKKIPEKVLALVNSFGCKRIYANIEYEVDELRRDTELCKLARPLGIQVNLRHNKSIIEPGVLYAPSGGKAYAVYSPYRKLWLKTANANLAHYLEAPKHPNANEPSVRESSTFGHLFATEIPTSISGFELDNTDKAKMAEIWPEGEERAREILLRFLSTKARSTQLGAVDPLAPGAQDVLKHNRIVKYGDDRDRADKDTTSRLSPYLSSGVISARELLRTTMELFNMKTINGEGDTGASRWIQEVIWRDFYTDVLASFPRVSMGRPFLEKYSTVVWENHQAPQDPNSAGKPNSDADGLMRWKLGKTGVPVVDAAMRCINEMGWVHNRLRMIVAMYLCKHLMIDWKVGERYFMEKLIDGDLASNNGGWQWSASTGVDPCPYFRIFNPHSQSTKADPSGDFIRHWVPELKLVRGPDLHNPSHSVVDKLGYPRPVIEHKEGRERAMRRFKNPGEA